MSSGSRLEAVFDRWHLEVLLALLDGTSHFEHHVVSAFWEVLLGNFFIDILHLLSFSVGVFVTWKIRIVKRDRPTGDHSDLYALVSLKPVKQTLES